MKKNNPHSRIYYTWNRIFNGCTNKFSYVWDDFGGKGIRICPRWKKYENFKADMDTREYRRMKSPVLVRVNQMIGFTQRNTKWVPRKEAPVYRINTRYVKFKGEKRTMSEWSRHYKRSTYAHVYYRMRKCGESFEDAARHVLSIWDKKETKK